MSSATVAGTITSVSNELPNAQEKDEKESYLRVTGHGKIKAFVSAALEFLYDEESEGTPLNVQRTLVLHTLPAQIDPRTTNEQTKEVELTTKQANVALSVVPRLISVTEIIKREYIALLETKRSPRLKGLFQYNQLRQLEDIPGVTVIPDSETGDQAKNDQAGAQASAEGVVQDKETLRSKEILNALSGKNFPRQTQSPYMIITLSTIEKPDLVKAGATYQPPTIRKLSKIAKYRAKKRAKKEAASASAQDEMVVE